MRAPKGGAGPHLQITYLRPSDSHQSRLPSQRPRVPSQTAAVDRQPTTGSSRSLAYPEQPSTPSVDMTPRRIPLSSQRASNSPSQIIYSQRQSTQKGYNSLLARSPTQSVASQIYSPTLSRYSPLRAVSPAHALSRPVSPAVSPAHSLSRPVSPAGLLASRLGSPTLSRQAGDLSPRIPAYNRAWSANSRDWSPSSAGDTSTRLVSLNLIIVCSRLMELLGVPRRKIRRPRQRCS